MLFTMLLALAAGDHLAAEPDALLAWASISVLTPDALLFCGRRNIAATPAGRLPVATETETNRSFDPASTRQRRMAGRQICRQEQKKGLQLALEPLNGQGIAGYVPQTGVMGAIS